MAAATAENIEPQTALITVEDIDAPRLFVDGEVNEVLTYIREQVDVVPDISTAKGRSDIKSVAYKIVRSKTLLDDIGKAYAADLKKRVANIDLNRRTLRDKLDALRDEIRAPLTAWEDAEKARADEIAGRINRLITAGQRAGSAAEIEAVLTEVKATELTEDAFGERVGEAAMAKDVAVSNLERAHAGAVKREQDAAELERLRREKVEQESRQAAEKREQAAADRAREAAEQAAKDRVEKAEREAREAQDAASRAQQAAAEFTRLALQEIDAIQHQAMIARTGRVGHSKGGTIESVDKVIAETEAWEITPERFGDLVESAEAAKQTVLTNVRQYRADLVKEADERARAAKAERDRIEADRRAADKEHRRKVNSAAVAALREWLSLDEDTATSVVTVIAAGRVPRVTVNY